MNFERVFFDDELEQMRGEMLNKYNNKMSLTDRCVYQLSKKLDEMIVEDMKRRINLLQQRG